MAKCVSLRWLRTRCQRFRLFNDERGVSAVEFALILPLMMMLYLVGAELTKAITINRRVTLAARTLADLVTQAAKVNAADMSNVLKAGEVVSGLMNDSSLKLRVSSVNVTPQGVATVEWSKALNHTQRPVGETVTVPAAFVDPTKATNLVWSEAEYLYTPSIGGGTWFGFTLGKPYNLQDRIYMRARLTDKVTCDAC